SRNYPDACIGVNASASEPTDRGTPIHTPGRLSACIAMQVDSPRRGASDGNRTTDLTPGACPATADAATGSGVTPIQTAASTAPKAITASPLAGGLASS